MGARPRRWPLALAAALVLGAACAPREVEPPAAPGPLPDEAPAAPTPPEESSYRPSEGIYRRSAAAQITALEALGYVDGAVEAPSAVGVVIHDPARAWQGLNLYSSGHGPVAMLMDMDGRELHRWERSFEEIWPMRPPEDGIAGRARDYWRRVVLLEGGHLLVVFEGQGIARLDARSNVVWASAEQVHHDLHVAPDGTLWALSRRAAVLPRISTRFAVLEDQLVRMGVDGSVLERISVLEALEANPELLELWRPRHRRGNLFHTNAVEVLDGSLADREPAFAAGNLMVSTRSFSALLVIDPDARKVVWGRTGSWRHQHDPRFVPGGGMLLFDNLGLGEGRSRVLELDPFTLETRWSYEGTPERPFYSEYCGAAARLPNGNTLISDSWVGRAFEVTPTGDVVWEFDNPARAASDERLVAIVPEVVRVPADRGPPW